MTNRFYQYFEDFASSYSKYRKRFKYYWNDIVDYNNFYINNTQSVLEIGCGTGETLHRLNGRNKTGIDYSPSMIEVAKKLAEVKGVTLEEVAEITTQNANEVFKSNSN